MKTWRNRISGYTCADAELIESFDWYKDEGGHMAFSEWIEDWEEVGNA